MNIDILDFQVYIDFEFNITSVLTVSCKIDVPVPFTQWNCISYVIRVCFWPVNSLAPGRCGGNFKSVISTCYWLWSWALTWNCSHQVNVTFDVKSSLVWLCVFGNKLLPKPIVTELMMGNSWSVMSFKVICQHCGCWCLGATAQDQQHSQYWLIIYCSFIIGTLLILLTHCAIWWHRSGSTLTQVTACLLHDGTKSLPEPMLTFYHSVMRHSPDCNFTRSARELNP